MVRVAVVGGINLDVFALVDEQPADDQPSIIEVIAEATGGKGANQAVAAARLGAAVRLLGAVGDDGAGERARRELHANGVDCTAVRVVAGTPTGRVVGTVTASGSKRTAALGGANLRLTVDDVRSFEPVIAGSDVVVCQLEPPPAVVTAVLDAAGRAGVPTLLDLAPAQGPVRELAAGATWVTANRAEAETATGARVDDAASAATAAKLLRASGPSIAGVTVGSLGQLVAWDGGEAWMEPDRSAPIVDTAGAGDAFAATLAVFLAEGAGPAEAARRAAAASTLACRALGAQAALPTREEVERGAAGDV